MKFRSFKIPTRSKILPEITLGVGLNLQTQNVMTDTKIKPQIMC